MNRMSDRIEQIRSEMFAKFEEDKKHNEEAILEKQSQCEHSYTTRSRVSSDGTHQIIGCGKCGHRVIKNL